MLKKPKYVGDLAAAVGFGAILLAVLNRELAEPVRILLVVGGDLLFLVGCGLYAKSKGCRFAWGLIVPLGFACIAACWFYMGDYQKLLKWTGIALTVVGLLALAFLPDKHRWGT
jgi:hypothetical protein